MSLGELTDATVRLPLRHDLAARERRRLRRRGPLESLRPRHDELRAARGDYGDAEPDLTNAVMSDCLRTVADAYSPDLGD